MYEYRCTVVKIVDGDTVDVDIDLGFGVWLKKERIRMFGIDTPESRTRDLEEKKYGLAAKEFLTGMLDDSGGIILKTQKDKEGKLPLQAMAEGESCRRGRSARREALGTWCLPAWECSLQPRLARI